MTIVTSIETGSPCNVDVTIVMPCLNEAKSLPHCIMNARDALELMRRKFGLCGEILVADNGSDDGSQLIARSLGVRVVEVERRGYGAALTAGFKAANGAYLVMGDADGSYDFRDSVAMVRRLREGADLCMGSRFKGRIDEGAMPWKNRYFGNPVLTFILNLFFKAGITDAHCGLRALTKSTFNRLELASEGMEFASELVVKAALAKLRIDEVPTTLSRDLRDRSPHLRPWRDGWRHLRYLMMLSPWPFAMPSAFLTFVGLAIWAIAGVTTLFGSFENSFFGNYWIILAGAMLGLGHISALIAGTTILYGRRQGYRQPGPFELKISPYVSLETMLVAGGFTFFAGLGILIAVLNHWSSHHYVAIDNVLPPVIGTTLMVIGAQNMLGGFLLAVATGNDAGFSATLLKAQSSRGVYGIPSVLSSPTRLVQEEEASQLEFRMRG